MTTPPSSRCPGIGCRMQKRQLRPRKVRLLSQDHVTHKGQTGEAINVEKSNALDGFLFPWPPTKPGSWVTSQGLPTMRSLGARVWEAPPVLLHGCGLELLGVSPLTLCLVCRVKGTVESVPGEPYSQLSPHPPTPPCRLLRHPAPPSWPPSTLLWDPAWVWDTGTWGPGDMVRYTQLWAVPWILGGLQ